MADCNRLLFIEVINPALNTIKELSSEYHGLYFQGMIRASVMQDQKSMQTKSVAPPLLIKLPAQAEESREKSSSPSTPTEQLDDNSEEEEEDDWDAFQSFPASKNEVAPTIKEEVVKSFSYSDFSTANNEIDNDSKEIMDVDQQAVEGEILSSVGGNHQSKELHGSEDSNHDSEEREDYQQEGDEAMPSNRIDNAFLDNQSVEVAEGYCEPSDNLHEERARQTPNSDIAEGSSEPSDDQHEGIAGQMPSLVIAEGYKEPSSDHHVEIAGQMSDLQSGEHAEGSI